MNLKWVLFQPLQQQTITYLQNTIPVLLSQIKPVLIKQCIIIGIYLHY